jgi:hypothetical protein
VDAQPQKSGHCVNVRALFCFIVCRLRDIPLSGDASKAPSRLTLPVTVKSGQSVKNGGKTIRRQYRTVAFSFASLAFFAAPKSAYGR